MTEYKLVRARRKTVSLQIKRDLSVTVRAPLRMPKREIDRFVQSHEEWLSKHLTRMRQKAERLSAFTFSDGDICPIQGINRSLAEGAQTYLEGDTLYLPSGGGRPGCLIQFLREYARKAVSQLIEEYAPTMGVRPSGIKITSAATRWGSCSGKDALCFSWRVACLPPGLLEYVVVHELAHIREHNHSPRFWAVVGERIPDYQQRRAELHQYQEKIPL